MVSGSGSVTIKGFSGGKPYEQTVPIQLPDKNLDNAVLPAIWARAKVDDITDSLNFDEVSESGRKEYLEQIEDIALKYKLLTNYTSFVAVDESGKTVEPSKQTSVVGVEAPDGMDLAGVFSRNPRGMAKSRMVHSSASGSGSGYGAMGVLPVSESFQTSPAAVPAPMQLQQLQVEPTVIDERHYTAGRSAHLQGAMSAAPQSSGSVQMHYNHMAPMQSNGFYSNLGMRSRNSMAMPLTDGDYVVSSLGLPASSKISPDVFKFDQKLDNTLKKLLRMPEKQKILCSLSVTFSDNQTDLISKLKELKFTVTTPDVQVWNGVLTLKDVPFERIHELLRLKQVEHISIQSLN
jgi:hypothetical protein